MDTFDVCFSFLKMASIDSTIFHGVSHVKQDYISFMEEQPLRLVNGVKVKVVAS